MAWRRSRRPAPAPEPAAETDTPVRWAPVPTERFDIAAWNRENQAELARRGEVEAHRRARALPYKATTATAAAGAGGWVTAELVGLAAGPAGHLVASAATPAAAAVALAAARLIHRERIGDWSATFDRASGGAVGWLATAAVTGPGWWQLLALGAGAVWVSAPWMRAHRAPLEPPTEDGDPAPELPAAPAAVTEDQGQRIAARWASEVIGPGGVIPRSGMLIDRVDLDRGYRWTVQLGRGDYYSKIAGMGEAVAAALAMPATAVLLEPYPGDASRTSLTVITRDALAGGVAYRGPVYDDGAIPVGLFADGDGTATVTVKDAGGVYPVALTGDPRTGKSVTFEAIAAALRDSGQWMVLFADGDPGAGSSSIMAECSHWPEAGPRGVLRQLECMEGVLTARQAIKATLTVDPSSGLLVPITDPARQPPAAKMLPSPRYPGWELMIDEGYRFAQDGWLAERGFVRRLEALVRTGPKYGLTVVYATHSRLNPDYGTSSLKGALHARNSLAFRAESSSEAVAVNGVLVYPAALPHGGGYAWSAHSGRVAMLRTGYPVTLPDRPFPKVVPDADSWLGAQPFWPEEEPDPAAAWRAAQQRRDAWRREAEARVRGEKPPVDTPGATDPAAPAAASTAYPRFGELLEQLPRLRRAANVVPFPRPAADDTRLSGTDRKMLDAVHAGARKSFQIVARTGLPGPTVSKAGKRLAELGLLIDAGHGLWTLPEDAEAAGS